MVQKKILTIGKRDTIAYPTIYIFGINTFLLICLFFIKYNIPYMLYLIFASILLYINFTPFHEASHKLIASKPYAYLNELIGIISSTIYGTSFAGWKYLHTLHHRHTNHDIDPDNFYNSLGEVLIKGPFLDVIYFYNYMKHIHTRPTMEVIDSLFTYMCIFSFYGWLLYNHHGISLFYYYIFPMRFAMLYASLVLDYNTHHKCPQKKDNQIQSTNKISGFFEKDDSPLLLSLFTQNQNYHNIHHLYPYIPFYKYQDVWNDKDIREHLIQEGTNEINISDNIESDISEIKENIQDITEHIHEHIQENIQDIAENIQENIHDISENIQENIQEKFIYYQQQYTK